ncbi:MAG: DNA adenine methylase [Acidobacteria bacterium]|nr:DNA adenine methylase [Acidobacteriota bacterium]
MPKNAFCPKTLLEKCTFPSTRYQGSKLKLVDWIWQQISDLKFTSALDAFGGTASVSYLLKTKGKKVTYNDLLCFNYNIGLALIENKNILLNSSEIDWLLNKHSNITYPSFVQEKFSDIYFTNEENALIDIIITNIRHLDNKYKFAIAFFALCQACIIKRPYNLFHRKNLYIRLADVERSFGNKASWDKPLDKWFRGFVQEANQAVFDNGQENIAYNQDALNLSKDHNLVYIDPPYISNKGIAVDYLGFYHFLEGLADYPEWKNKIDYQSKHHRFIPQFNEWSDKNNILFAFDKLFSHYQNSILVVSYRSDGIPSELQLVGLMKKYKRFVRLEYYGKYKYALSTNAGSQEILLIGT